MSEYRCSGFKPNGEPCARMVKESFSYCYSHDPNTLEERRRNNSKAGKGNSQKELKKLKNTLHKLLDDVLEDRIDARRASVAANVSNALSKVYTTAMKARELEELEERMTEIEAHLEQSKGSGARGAASPWG